MTGKVTHRHYGGNHEREDERVSALIDHRSDASDPAGSVDVEATALVSSEAAAGMQAEANTVYAPVERAQVEQDGPISSPMRLRVDFGAHLEDNYQRLVAQLYAITLDPREAHDVVQDAYSRAWRKWAEISRTADPTAWVRRVAVRSTVRSWRRLFNRHGKPVREGVDPRTSAILAALARLPAPERRCVVLYHMAGASIGEIAAIEESTPSAVQARLSRARGVVSEGLADVLPEVLGIPPEGQPYAEDVYPNEGEYR